MATARIEPVKNGLMADFSADPDYPCTVYGLQGNDQKDDYELSGTLYGALTSGSIRIKHGEAMHFIGPGEYFCIPVHGAFEVHHMSGGTEGFMVCRHGYKGLQMVGGPYEQLGRLRYIDGCSDSLLIGPPVKGDPCFNLLTFPGGIAQTMHTHPTIRAGLVHRGSGACYTAEANVEPAPLNAGDMFILSVDAVHAFNTEDTNGMALTVFHPDTTVGPWHDDHPMLNRSYVDDVSAKDIPSIHTREIT